MAVISQNYEGNASGTTITTANSANGTGNTAFYFIAINGTSTLTYDSTQAAHGSQAAKLTPSSGNTVNMQFGGTAAGSQLGAVTCAARWYFYQTSSITSTGATQISGMSDASGTRVCALYLDGTNKLYVRDSGTTPLWTATTAMPVNQWVRIEYWTKPATGEIHVGYYLLDNGTAVTGGTFDTTGAATGTNAVATVSLGRLFNTSDTGSFWLDDFAVDTAASGFIGAVTATTPLSLSGVVTPSTHTVGQTQTLTLTAAGGNGNALSYSVVWDGTNLGPQSSNVFTHVDSTAGTKNWTATVSQSS